MEEKRIDLSTMPSCSRYEDQYREYMEVFKEISHTPINIRVVVVNPPGCWIPLIWWLDGDVVGSQNFFPHDPIVQKVLLTIGKEQLRKDRTLLESLCCLRPELADSLWKTEMEWLRAHHRTPFNEEKEFIVTSSNSHYRREVLKYMEILFTEYIPTKRKCILVPCAADKPYPSPLHRTILDFLPQDYELIVATGVLGLVPMGLWDVAPHYDAGIPNQWRVMETVEQWFRMWEYERVVVYCDFYTEAIYRGLMGLPLMKKVFVTPIGIYFNYVDLLNPERIHRLKMFLEDEGEELDHGLVVK